MKNPFAYASLRRGFTLIELIVVIAIIAILSVVVMANFSDARKKSRDAKRLSDVAQIQLALELYYDQNRQFPATLDNGILAPDYIGSIPVPPAGTSQAEYAYVPLGASCASYHIGAVLELPNQALSEDDDAEPSSSLPSAGACAGDGSPASPDFDGFAEDCAQESSGEEDLCYDVKP